MSLRVKKPRFQLYRSRCATDNPHVTANKEDRRRRGELDGAVDLFLMFSLVLSLPKWLIYYWKPSQFVLVLRRSENLMWPVSAPSARENHLYFLSCFCVTQPGCCERAHSTCGTEEQGWCPHDLKISKCIFRVQNVVWFLWMWQVSFMLMGKS